MENVAATDVSKHGFRQKFLKFKGRLSREYFFKRVGIFVISMIIIFAFCRLFGEYIFAMANSGNNFGLFLSIMPVILVLILFVFTVILGWRRMHDAGMPGWLALILCLPIYCESAWKAAILYLAILAVIGLIPGTEGDNKYGPKPE